MIVSQKYYANGRWVAQYQDPHPQDTVFRLVLVFGAPELVCNADRLAEIRAEYPNAEIVLSSTAGEIVGSSVLDNSMVATAVAFEKTRIKCVQKKLVNADSAGQAGAFLMAELAANDLCGIFIVSDGTVVNGGLLADGLNLLNVNNVPIVGGLAGDGANFVKTYTGLNELPDAGNVVAVGFYGHNLLIGHGFMGGWEEFGRERTITKSDKNVLYEIDGHSALQLYKEYLGEFAHDLPSSALLFPLSLKETGKEGKLVRTILGLDEKTDCMVFAGNMPEGSKVRLMKSNQDNLVSASATAASTCYTRLNGRKPSLSILISCVGRKLVMHSRVAEEVEVLNDTVGANTAIAGFYSYGEISPLKTGGKCELHNQTMTITSFTEI